MIYTVRKTLGSEVVPKYSLWQADSVFLLKDEKPCVDTGTVVEVSHILDCSP